MQPVGTVVAFGAAPTHDVSRLDATALACDILRFGDDLFTRIKSQDRHINFRILQHPA